MKTLNYILYFLIGIFGFVKDSNAQYFQNLYGTSNMEVLNKGMKLKNFNNNAQYAMIGSTYSSTDTSLHFLSIDVLGNVTFEKTYSVTNASIYNSTFTEIINGNSGLGGYAIAARILKGGNDYILFTLVDNMGVVIQKSRISIGNTNLEVKGICESRIANPLTGYYEYYITGSINGDMYVIDINEMGTINWSKKYDYHSGWEDHGLSIIVDPYDPQQIVVCGNTFDAGNNNRDGFVSWINISNGNLNNYQQYDFTSKDVFFSIRPSNCYCEINNQKYLISGEVLNSTFAKDMLIMTILKGGAPSMVRFYDFAHNPNTENCAFDAIDFLDNNSCCEIYSVGYGQNFFGGQDVQLVKLDGIGNGISETVYGGTGNDIGTSICFDDNSTSNPGLGIFGTTASFTSLGAGQSDFYFIRPFRNGYVSCNTAVSTTFACSIAPSISSISNVYTLSTTVDMNFTISSASTGSVNQLCSTAVGGNNNCWGNTVVNGLMLKPENNSHLINIKIFPNPLIKESEIMILNVQDITSKTEYKNAEIFIYDLLGKQYLHVTTAIDSKGNISLPINGIVFSSGLYIMNIVLDNSITKNQYFHIK